MLRHDLTLLASKLILIPYPHTNSVIEGYLVPLNVKIHQKFWAYGIKKKIGQIQVLKNYDNVSYENYSILATKKGIVLNKQVLLQNNSPRQRNVLRQRLNFLCALIPIKWLVMHRYFGCHDLFGLVQ